MSNEKIYLEIVNSSEKPGMCFISCTARIYGPIIGYLSRSNKICYDLDKQLSGSDDYGAYFENEEEAIACISQFYTITEKID
jgi:hypothetical protein